MSVALKRPVRVIVATLDYLTSFQDQIEAPTVMSEAAVARMSTLALKDSLTQVFNRLAFQIHLEEEIHRHTRHGSPFCLIMLDLDDFKAVNDAFGHQVGDTTLREVSTALVETIRDLDTCARYGGEEFAILLPQTECGEALTIAERIRQRVQGLSSGERQITVSQGVACCPGHAKSATGIVRAADTALRLAKRRGKNRVEVYTRPLRGRTGHPPNS
jgi:diguanylate cyclase (GGDEF)-like protein